MGEVLESLGDIMEIREFNLVIVGVFNFINGINFIVSV
jgi:hypothetical protein